MSNRLESGLVSITFRQLSADTVINLVSKAKLDAIEWGGDIHVPHGDVETARRVSAQTREAGLRTAAYGSYYRCGGGADDGVSFDKILATCIALEAPVLRVWAGRIGSAESTSISRQRVVDDIRQCISLCAAAGVILSLEYHPNTLTDTVDSIRLLMREVAHPGLRLYWQPDIDDTTDQNIDRLKQVLSVLTHVHAYAWLRSYDAIERQPLVEAKSAWQMYLSHLKDAQPFQRAVMLEFVENDDPDAFFRDAQVLRELCGA